MISQCMKIIKGSNSNRNKESNSNRHNKDATKGAPCDCIPMRQLEKKIKMGR